MIGRCSQPLVGPNGRRSREDEKLMTAFNVKALGQKVPAKKVRLCTLGWFIIVQIPEWLIIL